VRCLALPNQNIAYSFNRDGSLWRVYYPSGRVITYAPSAAGRTLSAVDTTNAINYTTNALYAPHGAPTSLKNGVVSGGFAGITTTNGYNNRLQPVVLSAAAPAATVYSFTYDFNFGTPTAPINNGNVKQIRNDVTNDRTLNFTSDELNRIKTADTQANTGTYCWGQSFTSGIDIWANLKTITVSKCNPPALSLGIDTKNRITNTGFAYDAAGNMTNGGSGVLTYDAENRLTAAAGVTYTYDGDGKRVKKSSGKLYWTGMGSDTLVESDLAGTIGDEHIYFNAKRTARRTSAGVVNFYFADHLGTSRMITSATGGPCYDADYYPYGGERVYLNTCSQNYKFTGKERDAESGLDYFGARYYGSSLGRFTSPDRPFADQKPRDPQSWNLYSYVTNNPLRFVDPTGMVKRDATGQIIFTPQGKVDRNFTNGDSRRGTMQPGYIQADNGAKIQAFQQVGGSSAYKCDCHGLTFADGKYWVNNDQVNKLLKGDGYEKTKTPQAGDVAVFKANGKVVHSLTVTGANDKGSVTEVTGLGGTEQKAHSDTPEQVQQQFGQLLDTKVTVEYYHDSKPDRPTDEKLDQVKNYEKPRD